VSLQSKETPVIFSNISNGFCIGTMFVFKVASEVALNVAA
jgi:hypothetical protein